MLVKIINAGRKGQPDVYMLQDQDAEKRVRTVSPVLVLGNLALFRRALRTMNFAIKYLSLVLSCTEDPEVIKRMEKTILSKVLRHLVPHLDLTRFAILVVRHQKGVGSTPTIEYHIVILDVDLLTCNHVTPYWHKEPADRAMITELQKIINVELSLSDPAIAPPMLFLQDYRASAENNKVTADLCKKVNDAFDNKFLKNPNDLANFLRRLPNLPPRLGCKQARTPEPECVLKGHRDNPRARTTLL